MWKLLALVIAASAPGKPDAGGPPISTQPRSACADPDVAGCRTMAEGRRALREGLHGGEVYACRNGAALLREGDKLPRDVAKALALEAEVARLQDRSTHRRRGR